MKPNVVVINPVDNVGIALEDIRENEAVRMPAGEEFPALDGIPYSHKVALVEIAVGAEIYKYGEVIGRAAKPIKKGQWVHTHNLEAGGSS